MEAKLVRFVESMRGPLSCRSSTLGALALPNIVFLGGTGGSCQTRTPVRAMREATCSPTNVELFRQGWTQRRGQKSFGPTTYYNHQVCTFHLGIF